MLAWSSHSTTSFEAWVKTAPSTPYDLYARLRSTLSVNSAWAGIILRNSTTGKAITLSHTISSAQTQVWVEEWTNATTGTLNLFAAASLTLPNWLRIHNDGTTLTFYASQDGLNWQQLTTRTIATFLGSVDQMGIFCVPAASVIGAAWFGSFGTGTPS